MVESMPPQDSRPGRPRSGKSHDAILKATSEILRKEGLAGLSVDAVVAKAKVSKSTVYRRWDTKQALAMDAILRIFNTELDAPDTGTIAGDFKGLMLQFIEVLSLGDLGFTYVALLVDAQSNRTIERLHEAFFAERRAVLYAIIERGVSRGEIDPPRDPNFLIDLIFGPLIFRMLTGLRPLDETMADEILSAVLGKAGVADR